MSEKKRYTMNDENKYTISRDGSQWVDIKEAALLLGFSTHHAMYQAMSRGHLDGLRGRKLGGQTGAWRFHTDDIEDFLAAETQPISRGSADTDNKK